jgi:hypothetical protein
LTAALEPPPRFDVISYDVPPPPPEEIIYGPAGVDVRRSGFRI